MYILNLITIIYEFIVTTNTMQSEIFLVTVK